MVVTGGSVEGFLKVCLEVISRVDGGIGGEWRERLGGGDCACFRVVFHPTVVEQLEVDSAAKGPLFGVEWVEEGRERAGGESRGDGSMTKGRVGGVCVGEEGVEGDVD